MSMSPATNVNAQESRQFIKTTLGEDVKDIFLPDLLLLKNTYLLPQPKAFIFSLSYTV